uniref:Thaumatin-like protein 1 n=1 Tax=Aegilops tauschii TaxID=37682 RepID=M8AYJ9_AEGTA
MEAPRNHGAPCLLLLLALAAQWCSVSTASCSFTISNYCTHTIWPGTMAGAGTPQLPTTGFRLDPGQTVRIPAPAGWSGRIWARTGCNFSTDGAGAAAGAVACQTGDCGGGHMDPTAYSSVFKSACPRAYSYAYDDGSSLFTCNAVDYTIAFCLPPAREAGLNMPADANGAPPADNNGGGSAYVPPPTGNSGAGSVYQPPPAGNNGAGSAYQPPPTGNNGVGSAYQTPPTGTNGIGSTYETPLASSNGVGSAFQPPLTGDDNGVRSAYQPGMTPSSASTRYGQLWFLLPAALVFFK